uniref:Putative salivary secreted peptide n=1 Tax=Ixodes scapularis TaxID=6945 RepID=A0A4D5RPV5_IXOSC
MKVYLVKLAVLLAVMSFTFCTEDSESPAASDSPGSTEFPQQPVFCGASLDDQQKIMKCTQANKTAEQKLGNHAWIFCSNFTTFATNICNNTNHVFFNMTDQEEKTLNNLFLTCEKELGVTLPPTC